MNDFQGKSSNSQRSAKNSRNVTIIHKIEIQLNGLSNYLNHPLEKLSRFLICQAVKYSPQVVSLLKLLFYTPFPYLYLNLYIHYISGN